MQFTAKPFSAVYTMKKLFSMLHICCNMLQHKNQKCPKTLIYKGFQLAYWYFIYRKLVR